MCLCDNFLCLSILLECWTFNRIWRVIGALCNVHVIVTAEASTATVFFLFFPYKWTLPYLKDSLLPKMAPNVSMLFKNWKDDTWFLLLTETKGSIYSGHICVQHSLLLVILSLIFNYILSWKVKLVDGEAESISWLRRSSSRTMWFAVCVLYIIWGLMELSKVICSPPQ